MGGPQPGDTLTLWGSQEMGKPQPGNTLTISTWHGSQEMGEPPPGNNLTVFFSKDTLKINQVTVSIYS